MLQAARLLAFTLAGCALLVALPDDDEVVFRSDVSLVRVDAQVVDSNNRTVTHLTAEDFVLRLDGRALPIRNFVSEGMPVDVLFLLDVSASMRPHVQRIADASGQALTERCRAPRLSGNLRRPLSAAIHHPYFPDAHRSLARADRRSDHRR